MMLPTWYDCHHVGWAAGRMNLVAYLWEGISPQTHQMAALAGPCSLLQSDSNSFLNNFATVGGGAVYGTNATSLKLICAGADVVASTTACDSWAGNGVQQRTQGNGLQLQVCSTLQPNEYCCKGSRLRSCAFQRVHAESCCFLVVLASLNSFMCIPT